MRRSILPIAIVASLLATAGAVGCGNTTGPKNPSSQSTTEQTLRGRLSADFEAKSPTVVAVDETGKRRTAQTDGASFDITLPANHRYRLYVADSAGASLKKATAIVFPRVNGTTDVTFTVESGVASFDLGTIRPAGTFGEAEFVVQPGSETSSRTQGLNKDEKGSKEGTDDDASEKEGKEDDDRSSGDKGNDDSNDSACRGKNSSGGTLCVEDEEVGDHDECESEDDSDDEHGEDDDGSKKDDDSDDEHGEADDGTKKDDDSDDEHGKDDDGSKKDDDADDSKKDDNGKDQDDSKKDDDSDAGDSKKDDEGGKDRDDSEKDDDSKKDDDSDADDGEVEGEDASDDTPDADREVAVPESSPPSSFKSCKDDEEGAESDDDEEDDDADDGDDKDEEDDGHEEDE